MNRHDRRRYGVCLDCSARCADGRTRCRKHLKLNAETQIRRKEARRAWRKANGDRLRKYNKTYRENNIEAERAKARERYAKDPSKKRAWVYSWRKRNPDKVRDIRCAWNYGLAHGDYARMHDAQRGLCASCGQPETALTRAGGSVKALAVDHCHATNRVRELLCSRCNSILGLAQDSPRRLAQAIAYLARHGIG
jgi:hypothetical protein